MRRIQHRMNLALHAASLISLYGELPRWSQNLATYSIPLCICRTVFAHFYIPHQQPREYQNLGFATETPSCWATRASVTRQIGRFRVRSLSKLCQPASWKVATPHPSMHVPNN